MQLRSATVQNVIQVDQISETSIQEFKKQYRYMLDSRDNMSRHTPYINKLKYAIRIYDFLEESHHIWSLPRFRNYQTAIHHRSKELLSDFNMELAENIDGKFYKQYYFVVQKEKRPITQVGAIVHDFHQVVTRVLCHVNSIIEQTESFKINGYPPKSSSTTREQR